jgi:hypothetical protein
VDLRVVVWIREFLSGHIQRVQVERQLTEEGRVESGVPHGKVLGPLLLLMYIHDIWRDTESTIRLFIDNYIIQDVLKIMVGFQIRMYFVFLTVYNHNMSIGSLTVQLLCAAIKVPLFAHLS